MKCPHCPAPADTKVIRTATNKAGQIVRTRECFGPGHRFLTTEITDAEINALREQAYKFEQMRRLLANA